MKPDQHTSGQGSHVPLLETALGTCSMGWAEFLPAELICTGSSVNMLFYMCRVRDELT